MYFSLITLLIASMACTAQQQQKSELNEPEVIEALAAGVLVCVIPDYAKKLKILERELADVKSPARSKRLKKLIDQTKSDRDEFEKELTSAMDSLYDFSDVAYISSSDLPRFVSPEDGMIPQHRDVIEEEHKIFFLIRGSVESGADALIITDDNLNPLGRPYPYYVRLQGIASLIESFFSPGDHWKGMDKTIEKLNERLHRYLSN